MTLDTNEFIRRFLIHVLPGGFHRDPSPPRKNLGLVADTACRFDCVRKTKPLDRRVALG
jgi:Putative transposase